MDSVGRTQGIVGSNQVHERQAGGNKQQADAFRRAMEEHAAGGERPTESETPVRRELQRRPPISRRDEGEAHHVDVVA